MRFLFASIILLPPALASGATLPAASKAFVTRDRFIGVGIAMLYGANVAGATLGAFATTFFTIGLWGFPATAWFGTIASLLAGALAFGLDRLTGYKAPPPPPPAKTSGPRWRMGATIVGSAYFAVGFCSLASEVAWTRIYAQYGANPATYVFGCVLVLFLLGHGFGSGVVYPLLLHRFRPERIFPVIVWAACLLLIGATALLIIIPTSLSNVDALMVLGIDMPWDRTVIMLPAVLVPAIMTGTLFPLSSRLVIPGISRVGRGVGTLSAISTSGGILGSFVTGFFLMPTIGALRCLFLIGGIYALAAVWSRWALRGQKTIGPLIFSGALSAAVIAGVIITCIKVPPHAYMPQYPGGRIVAYEEGLNSATAVVVSDGEPCTFAIHGELAGIGGSDVILATQLHPMANRILSIGVGSGTISADALRGTEAEEVWAVDVVGELMSLMPKCRPKRAELFKGSRFRFLENDGRHFLRINTTPFDIILNDAATYAFYLELSTIEFNQLARNQLAPEGLFIGRIHPDECQEETLRREIATFIEVFPNSAMWASGLGNIKMLIGRKGNLPVDTNVKTASQYWQEYAPYLVYNAEQLKKIAKGAKLITDARPLHVPDVYKDSYFQ